MDSGLLQQQQAARERVARAQEHARRLVEGTARRDAVVPLPPTGGDNEQLLLLLLAFLLYRNNASPEIVLALLWLAL